MKTLRETIREITRRHLENGGLLFGQAIKAVGWVNNTVPDCKNIIELPMSDVSNMGIACGAAIAGRRPIIVIRFQDFMWLNGSILVNYAAKSKDILGTPTPIFVRALAKDNVGCVHSGVLHSLFMYMPGLRVCSPMTPLEYERVWEDFMEHDEPIFVSEHRASFDNSQEFHTNLFYKKADITLFPISAIRLHIAQVREKLKEENIKANIVHIDWLKPLKKRNILIQAMESSNMGLVIDAGFETCGVAQSIAYELMLKTGKKVKALGLEDRSVSVGENRNPMPSARRIVSIVKELIDEKNSVD